MKRDIEQALVAWKNQKNHLPILLRGARQVGKSYLVENFGRKYFDNLLIVNFELDPRLGTCFENLNPHEIIQKLSILMRHPIEPTKTLLFLDEIQDCPNAIRALRYFKEQLPQLHVIGAGSLLEFTLNDAEFSMAEVDYISTAGAQIIPIEVKAGATGQLKSLHLLMSEKNLKLGIRVSQNPLSFDGKIASIPFYMVGELSRLVAELM